MLIIRLTRTGKKNSSSFRVVVIEKTAPPKSGKFLEILGNYNPRLPAKGGSASGGKEENEIKEAKEKTPVKEESLPKADALSEQTSDKKEEVSQEIKKEKEPAQDESLPENEGVILDEKKEKITPNLDKSEEKSKIEEE